MAGNAMSRSPIRSSRSNRIRAGDRGRRRGPERPSDRRHGSEHRVPGGDECALSPVVDLQCGHQELSMTMRVSESPTSMLASGFEGALLFYRHAVEHDAEVAVITGTKHARRVPLRGHQPQLDRVRRRGRAAARSGGIASV